MLPSPARRDNAPARGRRAFQKAPRRDEPEAQQRRPAGPTNGLAALRVRRPVAPTELMNSPARGRGPRVADGAGPPMRAACALVLLVSGAGCRRLAGAELTGALAHEMFHAARGDTGHGGDHGPAFLREARRAADRLGSACPCTGCGDGERPKVRPRVDGREDLTTRRRPAMVGMLGVGSDCREASGREKEGEGSRNLRRRPITFPRRAERSGPAADASGSATSRRRA
jgi:hypothetical protein